MSIDLLKVIAQFPFLGNEELVPDSSTIERVRVSRISLQLLHTRPRVDSATGNLVDMLHEDRVWLFDRGGNVLCEVMPEGKYISYGSHDSPQEDEGETVGDAVLRVGPEKVHYALRIERGDEWRQGDGDRDWWYQVTVYKAPKFSLTEWAERR